MPGSQVFKPQVGQVTQMTRNVGSGRKQWSAPAKGRNDPHYLLKDARQMWSQGEKTAKR